MAWDWAIYGLAASGLVASHALPSAPGVRPRLVDLLGRRLYLAAYSLLSLLALGAFVWAYGHVGSGPWLYAPLPYARPAAVGLMPLAFLLVVGRLTTPAGPAPTGVYRLSRSPGSVGVLLWALLHLANTGDARRVVLFLTMAAIAAVAVAKNELVLRGEARRAGDAAARSWLAAMGAVPFAAIARSRQAVRWAEIGVWRVTLALAAYAALLLAHPYLFGVDPLAGL